jgi:hypothetical protein
MRGTRPARGLAGEGAAIDVDVFHRGRLHETISFGELVQRSAALRKESIVPLAAKASVTGPGIVAPKQRQRIASQDYLPDCRDCTAEMPCNTECGYDPGKGGPVTCGEQGQPCEPYCSATWYYDFYTAWTYYSTGYGGTMCYRTSTYFSQIYNQRITTYRREKIRRTTTCPNSPTCNGYYETDSVIQVQYSYSICYEETPYSCANGVTPCCYNLCDFSFMCSNSYPCY